MATAPQFVHPKQELPKTLGILNVIFGVLLVLLGLCVTSALVFGPTMMGGFEKILKEAQSKVEVQQKARVKQYDDRIAGAKTDEEKKRIEAEKADVVASQPQVKVDFSMFSRMMTDPTIRALNYAGALTGLALHVVLLISGIGLIRLTSWGRSLGIWWAGFQIVQVLALLVATIVYAFPIQQATTEKMLVSIQEQNVARGVGGPADAGAIKFARAMISIQAPITIIQSLVGCVYPVVLLCLLNTSGARAACQPRKPIGPPTVAG